MAIPPNNYPFYNDDERYQPVVQPDGGQLSDWKPLYQPSEEQEAEDRRKAYESGVPHGYVPRGFRYEGMPTIKITVQSELVSPLSSSLRLDLPDALLCRLLFGQAGRHGLSRLPLRGPLLLLRLARAILRNSPFAG